MSKRASKQVIASFLCYWKDGSWARTRLPAVMALYGIVVALPLIVIHVFIHLPAWLRYTNLAIVLVNCCYCFVAALITRRAWKQAEREYDKAKQKLAEGIRPMLLKLSVMINYRDRPSAVELAHAAQVVYACRFHRIEGCEVELGLVEAWVRHWDEEKVSQ